MLNEFVSKFNITLTGVLHVGANDCIEYDEYRTLTDNIIYIEANPTIVNKVKESRPEINIFQALITDNDNINYDFNISSNNSQSSSILDFNLHKVRHPTITFIDTIKLDSITIDNFITKYKIDSTSINALVLDIQGVELKALKGGTKLLENISIIYTEINIGETYTGCDKMDDIDSFLSGYGFTRVFTHIFDGHTYGDAVYIRPTNIKNGHLRPA